MLSLSKASITFVKQPPEDAKGVKKALKAVFFCKSRRKGISFSHIFLASKACSDSNGFHYSDALIVLSLYSTDWNL